MSLFFAELRKVWGGRVFPALLAILAAANLLLLWMVPAPQPNSLLHQPIAQWVLSFPIKPWKKREPIFMTNTLR